MEKVSKFEKNFDYTARNLLHYLYHQKYDKRIGIDLLRLKNIIIPQQISFVEKIEEDVVQHDDSFLSPKSSKKQS